MNEWSLISYLARVNYRYNNKYYLTASIRSDGSSCFGKDNRYGYFPSGSVALENLTGKVYEKYPVD